MQSDWGNDISDVKNLNSAWGNNSASVSQNTDKTRAIDWFYPFIHTGRIEQLAMMETTSKEPLPKNLVTAGERAEYFEIGIRYGLKEIIFATLVFLTFILIQFVVTLKSLSLENVFSTYGTVLAILLIVIYGASYTAHIAKYNVGVLTSKVIISMLMGRLIAIVIFVVFVGWTFWVAQQYVLANPNFAETLKNVFPTSGGFIHTVLSAFFSVLMIPFGGAFKVTPQSLVFAVNQMPQDIFSNWRSITIVAFFSSFLTLGVSVFFRRINEIKRAKPEEQLEVY